MSRHLNEYRAESASYALLRRLAPILNHDLAGALQPLHMTSLVLEKRLQNSNLDHAALIKSSSQLKIQVREASSACMGLMSWLTSNNSDMVSVAAGVEEAAGLITSSLSFKGFTLVNMIGDVQAELPREFMRNAYMAALLAITDSAVAPADVLLEAERLDNAVVLRISILPTVGEVQSSDSAPYRNLEWDDVEALAEIHGVRVARGANSMELHAKLAVA